MKIDPKELEMGIEIEFEHTNDPNIAEKIARDHLKEVPDYYTRLKKMEKEAMEKPMKKAFIHVYDNIFISMEKANHKYIKRIPHPNPKPGRKYIYFYNQKQIKDYKEKGIIPGDKVPKETGGILKGIMSFFGFKDEKKAKEKVSSIYNDNKDKLKGVSHDVFADYMNEYLSNKESWDNKLSPKEKKESEPKEEKEKKEPKEQKEPGEKKQPKWNMSLMRKVAGIVGGVGKDEYDNINKEIGKVFRPFTGNNKKHEVIVNDIKDGKVFYKHTDGKEGSVKIEDFFNSWIKLSDEDQKTSKDNFEIIPEEEIEYSKNTKIAEVQKMWIDNDGTGKELSKEYWDKFLSLNKNQQREALNFTSNYIDKKKKDDLDKKNIPYLTKENGKFVGHNIPESDKSAVTSDIPKEFERFANIALKHGDDTFSSYREVARLNDVASDVSSKFREKYGASGGRAQDAWEKFVDDVNKSGMKYDKSKDKKPKSSGSKNQVSKEIIMIE
jgi:hypothetical protein